MTPESDGMIRMTGADWNWIFNVLSIRGLSPALRRRIMAHQTRIENTFRESDMNPERFYFRVEYINGLFEEEA